MQFSLDSNSEYFDIMLRMANVTKSAHDAFSANAHKREHDYAIRRLTKIPLNISVNTRLTTTYGMANYHSKNSEITSMYIELNKNARHYGQRLMYQIMSHELAHCIDFLIRGDSFHDEEWSELHKMMGGKGTTFIY